ncbi:MAG: XdhC family protein [Ignavibacteriales bacterium]
MMEVLSELQRRFEENRYSVLVTIVSTKGSSPGKAGFKMLVGEEGRIKGTIGGGGVEHYAINKSIDLLRKDVNSHTETFIMKESMTADISKNNFTIRDDGVIEVDALCGGEVTLFYEVFKPVNILYIFGAGHVGQAIARMAKLLHYHVVIYDDRESVLNEMPEHVYNQRHYSDFSKLSDETKIALELNTQGFALIVTHNHLNDLQVLEYLYRNYPGMKYIGLIGSRRKVKESLEYIHERFNGRPDLSNLYAPVGIDLGGDTPDEIAMSILAELQALQHGKEVKHLRLNYNEIIR